MLPAVSIMYWEFRMILHQSHLVKKGTKFGIEHHRFIPVNWKSAVYVPSEDKYFLYDDSKVYFRTPIYGRKAVSGWEMNNKTGFIFFNDGTCLDKSLSDKESESFCIYTETIGIIRLAFPLLPSPQYFLQDGNRLFSGFSYLYK